MKQTIKRGLDWFQATRVGRTLTWYSERNGAQLCGGIAYSALFSLFAALTIGWSFFAASLGRNDALRGAVLDQIDGWVPGLIGTGSTDLVNPDQLVLSRAINPASIIAVIVGLLSAIGVMGALQSAIRSMFHVPAASGKALWKRVGQLLGFLLLGAGVVIAAGVSVASHQMGNLLQHWSAGSAGPAGGQVSHALVWLVRGLAALVGVGLDTLVVVGVIRFVGRIRPRDARQRRDLWLGSLAVGVIAAGLHWAGTTVVVGSAAHNALLAPFAAIVTILVLVNFVARVLLYACAWIHLTEHPEECQRRGLPSA